ncbi:hypothetical protein RFI_30914 [Reticulomyxa filosa]|uniref:Uncharacterized protein n=1 Tax=Reticulomyxa filosa TaxID=46433 RepID=X6M0H7_RETFI|nr:hypothetical protein RFI_30914 [Reticulomyxa filosa]|eukprot:ETO06475.1 hypothetical protein RFI_30914 [Reticulomyxa filosa]
MEALIVQQEIRNIFRSLCLTFKIQIYCKQPSKFEGKRNNNFSLTLPSRIENTNFFLKMIVCIKQYKICLKEKRENQSKHIFTQRKKSLHKGNMQIDVGQGKKKKKIKQQNSKTLPFLIEHIRSQQCNALTNKTAKQKKFERKGGEKKGNVAFGCSFSTILV